MLNNSVCIVLLFGIIKNDARWLPLVGVGSAVYWQNATVCSWLVAFSCSWSATAPCRTSASVSDVCWHWGQWDIVMLPLPRKLWDCLHLSVFLYVTRITQHVARFSWNFLEGWRPVNITRVTTFYHVVHYCICYGISGCHICEQCQICWMDWAGFSM